MERLVLEMVDILWNIFVLRLRFIQAMNRDIVSLMSAAFLRSTSKSDTVVVVAWPLFSEQDGLHECIIAVLELDAYRAHRK